MNTNDGASMVERVMLIKKCFWFPTFPRPFAVSWPWRLLLAKGTQVDRSLWGQNIDLVDVILLHTRRPSDWGNYVFQVMELQQNSGAPVTLGFLSDYVQQSPLPIHDRHIARVIWNRNLLCYTIVIWSLEIWFCGFTWSVWLNSARPCVTWWDSTVNKTIPTSCGIVS